MTFQTTSKDQNNRYEKSPEGLETELRSIWLGMRDSTLAYGQPGSHGRRASGGCMPLACAFESSHTQATQKAHLTGELLAWLG